MLLTHILRVHHYLTLKISEIVIDAVTMEHQSEIK